MTSQTKREAPVEFSKKKIEEAVRNDVDWSGENKLVEEDELEAKGRVRNTCLSPKLIAGPREVPRRGQDGQGEDRGQEWWRTAQGWK